MQVDPHRCQEIAGILCAASERVLWPELARWSPRDTARHRLFCRVGTGEATYYRADGRVGHLLTYGRKMVASKHCAVMARQWLTGRELLQRAYFDGQFTFSGLLAHTCCHEFAHLVQGLNGWMAPGSVHNRQFYRVLDAIHDSGVADKVLVYIEGCATEEALELNFIDGPETHRQVGHFSTGELVSFVYRGQSVLGEVIRVNRKTVNVKPIGPGFAAEYFRVSPHFLKLHRESPVC